MTPLERAKQHAARVLEDLAHTDTRDVAVRLEGVTNRIFVAMKESAQAVLAVGTEAPAARAERLHLYGQMLNALCRDRANMSRAIPPLDSFLALAKTAREAHEAFCQETREHEQGKASGG